MCKVGGAQSFNINSYFNPIIDVSLQGRSKTISMFEMGGRHSAYKSAGLFLPERAVFAHEFGYLNAVRKACTLLASCQRGNYEVLDS